MLISQSVSSCNVPRLREAMLFGGTRQEWEAILDGAWEARHDEAVLRVLESDARREERRREMERKLVFSPIAPAMAATLGRPNLFRRLFKKNIGGVADESDAWFDADYVAVDSGSGKTSDVINYIANTDTIHQIDASFQPVAPSADAQFANAKSIPWTAAELLISTRAPARWTFLGAGAGGCIVYVWVPAATANSVVFGTRSPGAPRGLWAFQNVGIGGLSFEISTGVATVTGQSVTGLTTGVGTYVRFDYLEGRTPEVRAYGRGSLIASGASLADPVATDPGLTFRIGDTSNGSFPSRQRFRACYAFHDLSDAGAIVVGQHIQAQTGIAPS